MLVIDSFYHDGAAFMTGAGPSSMAPAQRIPFARFLLGPRPAWAAQTGKTQQEIASACKGARPNHVGAAISRHKRTGRMEERDGKLYATQSTGTERRAAV